MSDVLQAFRRVQNGELISGELAKIIPESGIIVVAGSYGSGKSVMSYAILEYCHYSHPRVPVYIYGFPQQSEYLLPNWINVCESEEFPENSIVLVDEAYMQFSSRESQSKKNKFINNLAGLVRQKNILTIFVTPTLHKLEKGLLTATELLLVKKVSLMQVELDKSELRKKLRYIMDEFKRVKGMDYDIKKSVYMISNTECEEGMLINANGLPSFWTENLSHAWMGVNMKN